MSEFIIRENQLHHCSESTGDFDSTETTGSLMNEDAAVFDYSFYYAVYSQKGMVGSVKVTRWNEHITLPIQRLFQIDPDEVACRFDVKTIWHVGRFAISKQQENGAALLRRLITLAIYPICLDRSSLMVAECDKKFVRGLNMLGIKTGLLGEGMMYLGSETLPIFSKREWLLDYLDKSQYHSEAHKMFDQKTTTRTEFNRNLSLA